MSKITHPVRKDAPKSETPVVAPNAIDAALVLKAVNTMVSLKRERDFLRADCDRKSLAVVQLQNLIAEKDRAFAKAVVERDAWRKTAETVDLQRRKNAALIDVAEARREVADGRAKFWQAMWIAQILVFVAVVVVKCFFAR